MRLVSNFLIGLVLISLYPLIGTIIALVFPNKGSNWSWFQFGVGPIILVFMLAIAAGALFLITVFGAGIRHVIGKKHGDFAMTLFGR